MSLIATADLHFTDQPRDAHRWDLLPWLAKQATKYKAEAVLLLGDLTDAKDKHSSALTNKMVQGLRGLAEVVPVYIIRGNHDYIDESEPFFGFMDHTQDDAGPRIRFLTKPTLVRFSSMSGQAWLLPNTRNYEQDWDGLELNKARYVFTHQTFDGCLTENGTRLEGIPPSYFKDYPGKVWSGDIHKPQKVGKNIEYVGAPYRCRFGDDYEPRVLLINDDGTTKDLRFPTKNKVLVKLDNMGLRQMFAENEHAGVDLGIYEGDQIKVRVELPRARYAEWPAIRAEIIETATAMGLELTGPELVALAPQAKATTAPTRGARQAQTGPEGAVVAYAAQKGAATTLQASGLAYLKHAQAIK